MTSQAAAASFCKNKLGKGAKININVSTNSTNDKTKQSKNSSVGIIIDDEDDVNIALTKWLGGLHLDNIFNKLTELGVSEIKDMLLLDEEDFNSLNLKKIEMKKLKLAITKLE